MKRLLAITLCALIASSAFGQLINYPSPSVDWGGATLEDNIVIGISIMPEKAKYSGLSYADRVDVDPELATDFPELVEKFVNSGNHELKKWASYSAPQTIYFSTKTEGRDYFIQVLLKEVFEGGYVVADAKLVTPTGVATFTNLRGPGGKFGSYVNLLGDGLEGLGKDMAKRLMKAKSKKEI